MQLRPSGSRTAPGAPHVPDVRWVLPNPRGRSRELYPALVLPWAQVSNRSLERGWLTQAVSLMGKLRHEEVKANISKGEMLQALFSAVPRSCRPW